MSAPRALRRRDLLAAAVAALAVPSLAWGTDTTLVGVQGALSSFSPRGILAAAAAEVRVPGRIRDDLLALVPDGGGFFGLRQAVEDPALRAAASELGRRMSRMPAMLGVVHRACRAMPTTEAGLSAWLDQVARAHLGLDLPRLRAETVGLPPGLGVVYGPATRVHEMVGLTLAGPFTTWLELVHGRSARVVRPVDRDTFVAESLELLLDPAIEVVCTVGHGTWTSLDLSGVYIDPVEALRIVADRGARSPRRLAEELALGGVEGVLQRPRRRNGALEEADLAALVGALPESRRPKKKQVVRHTCGFDRYEAPAGLLWDLLPVELRPGMARRGDLLSAERPSTVGSWEARFMTWLSETSIPVVERPAFGTCLVSEPSRTVGYEGEAWIDDYVRDPIPAWRPGAFPAAPT